MSTEKTPERLSYDRTVELLREVVAEFGEDYVYEPPPSGAGQCLYVDEGKPSCIVAQVLVRAGVPVEDLCQVEYSTPTNDEGVVGEFWRNVADRTARVLLTHAQLRQDMRMAWGEAVEQAIELADQNRQRPADERSEDRE